jgi:hypothetical protein
MHSRARNAALGSSRSSFRTSPADKEYILISRIKTNTIITTRLTKSTAIHTLPTITPVTLGNITPFQWAIKRVAGAWGREADAWRRKVEQMRGSSGIIETRE